MPSGTVEANFAATAARVWSVLIDLENAPAWVPDVISVKKLDPGPIGTGSRFAQVVEVQGRRMELLVTLTEFEPLSRIAHSGVGKSVKLGGRTTIATTETGCRVTNEWTLELSGFLKLGSSIAAAWTRRNIEASMEALRKQVEHGSHH
jgi:carbon monoxide dehydrogenase subunit G